MSPWLEGNLAEPEEAIKIRIWERDDIADILAALNIKIPDWVIGAAIWYAFTKLVLDSLSPNKPGTEINLAILAASYDLPIIGKADLGEFPPGIKVAAFIDVIIEAIKVSGTLKPPTPLDVAMPFYNLLARFGILPELTIRPGQYG